MNEKKKKKLKKNVKQVKNMIYYYHNSLHLCSSDSPQWKYVRCRYKLNDSDLWKILQEFRMLNDDGNTVTGSNE